MSLPEFVYLYLLEDIYDRDGEFAFPKNTVIRAKRHPDPDIGWVTRMWMVMISYGQAYEPEPGDAHFGEVEKHIKEEVLDIYGPNEYWESENYGIS